jgi:hypothetical protein
MIVREILKKTEIQIVRILKMDLQMLITALQTEIAQTQPLILHKKGDLKITAPPSIIPHREITLQQTLRILFQRILPMIQTQTRPIPCRAMMTMEAICHQICITEGFKKNKLPIVRIRAPLSKVMVRTIGQLKTQLSTTETSLLPQMKRTLERWELMVNLLLMNQVRIQIPQ